jgi:hypothetical protein
MLRQKRKFLDIDKIEIAPDFFEHMMVYSVQCRREAERLERILKVRERRYDRRDRIVTLIEHVYGGTGMPRATLNRQPVSIQTLDLAIASLLTNAFEAIGIEQQYSGEAIRKIRESPAFARRPKRR